MDNYLSLKKTNENLKRKVRKYEKLFNDINKDFELDKSTKDIPLEELCHPYTRTEFELDDPLLKSIIYERDKEGNLNKKRPSDFGDYYSILDNNTNLNEVSKNELRLIREQDNFSSYEKHRKFLTEAGSVYGWGLVIMNVGKLAIGII